MHSYRALGGRTVFATLAVSLAMVAAFGSDFASLALAHDTADEAVLVNGAIGLVQLLAAILAAIAVCVWMHCAASNLRALGNPYLNFTPAGAAGWWFVPFANLVKPYQAMSEIVRASDPATIDDGRYMPPQAPPTLGFWWAAWISSNVVANVSMRIDDPEGAALVSLASSALWLVAGVLLILIMRRVEGHQEECRQKLAPAWQPPAMPYRGPGYAGY